jgi:Uncharacterized protein conserved in bacteria (DUF2064).
MPIIALLADPPREGLVYPKIVEDSPLTAASATELYTAVLKDMIRAIAQSGASLLINHPTEEQLSESETVQDAGESGAESGSQIPPEAELRSVVAETIATPDSVRFEPQVGSTFSARAGNTATHLLREEGAKSVAILRPQVPLLTRTRIDQASIKLRSNDAVIGPGTEGRCYYPAFGVPIDFEAVFTDPEVESITARAREGDGSEPGDVEFVPPLPVLERGADLLDIVPNVRARVRAGRQVPEHTAQFVADHGLRVRAVDGERRLVTGE